MLIPKKEPLVKNNDTLFYLGKDDNGLKYFFDKPHFSCGWYYSRLFKKYAWFCKNHSFK